MGGLTGEEAKAAVAAYLDELAHQRRASPLTLEGYGHDLAALLVLAGRRGWVKPRRDLTGRFWIITGSSLAILVAGLAALLAWRAGNRRLPLYFLLIMVTFLLISQSSVPLPVMMMVLGLLITLIGSYMLGRFLLTHPRLL